MQIDTFFLPAKFSRAAREQVVKCLKKNKTLGLRFDLILYYRVRQIWHIRAHKSSFSPVLRALGPWHLKIPARKDEIVAKFLMPAVTKSQRSQLGAAL